MGVEDTQSFNFSQNLKRYAMIGYFLYVLRVHEEFGDYFKRKIHDSLSTYNDSFIDLEFADDHRLIFYFFPLL
jgi:hypothetical protein